MVFRPWNKRLFDGMQHFSKSTWAASRCTSCHHCHYHSSKMVRTLDTNQRTKSQTCRVLSIYIPRPAEIDSQQLQQTWCEQKVFLTKWIGKQTNTSSTEQNRKSKLRTSDTNQRICRLKVLKFLSRGSRKQSNPLDNGLSAKQWAGEQIQSQNLNASMCNIRSLNLHPETCRIDSQQLEQTRCWQKLCLTSSYQIQPAPSPTKWIGKANKYELN